MKIFCIGRNYVAHAKELNNPIPEEPVIFMKPPTALLRDNQPFYIPDFSEDVHYEVELVLKVCKNGKSVEAEFANKYYDAVGLGIDFTARDIQANCKAKGLPWEKAKAFDHSAVLGRFLPLSAIKSPESIPFRLEKNNHIVQSGESKDMLFSFDELIVQISKYFTLQQGDLIYTGTPAGVGQVNKGDTLKGYIQEELMFTCEIK